MRTDSIISEGSCFIVAEVGQAHDGSLGSAHAYIDAAATAGADAVKFQTHLAEAEGTLSEPWRIPFSRQDASRREYWKRTAFTEPQWQGLRDHANDVGLKFLSSPFSIEAVELLERVGVAAWKIASGELSNTLLLDRVSQSELPVLLSSGMSSVEEIDDAVDRIRGNGATVVVLQCTSLYPTPPEGVGLNMLAIFRERYGLCGLSDHSGTIFAGLAAATIGIDVLEVHVTLSRAMFGPDVPASITVDELNTLVKGVRFIELARRNPVDKTEVPEQLLEMRRIFGRSIVARQDLSSGTILVEADLALKKPGDGLPPSRLKDVIGRRLVNPLSRDALLRESDLAGGQ